MGRLFDGVNDALNIDSAVTTVPFSMGCWFRPDNVLQVGTLMFLGNKDLPSDYHILFHRFFITDFVAAHTINGVQSGIAQSTSGATRLEWNHALGVWASQSSRTVYLNGGNSATDSTATGPVAENRTQIGRIGSSTPLNYFDGLIAHAAVWSTALHDSDAIMLHAGISPIHIQLDNLVAYWPLFRAEDPEPDYSKNSNDLGVFGPTANKLMPPAGPPFGWNRHASVWTQRVSSPHRRRMAATHKKPC